jgi:Protein of unknown function (DUF541).
MKISVLLAIAATIAAAALFAACGGSDASTGGNQTSQIKTQHGLAVAALAADFARSSSSTTNTTANSAAAPAAQTGPSGGTSSGGSAAADISKSAAGSSSLVAGAPQASTSNDTGITVQGYGMATADADSAIVQFYFSNYNNIVPPMPVPMPDANGSSGSTPSDVKPSIASPGTVSPITQADLQPVINALTNAGVAASDIQFSGQGYYDMYSSSATLTATIKTLSIVDSAVTAAQSAAANLSNITLQSTNVSYTLQDCKPLESAAMKAAVTDAGERAGLLADALSVKLGNVTGASDYSYSPAGVPCSSNFYGPYPMPYGIAYDSIKSGGTSSNSVQVVAQISVTYAMQ